MKLIDKDTLVAEIKKLTDNVCDRLSTEASEGAIVLSDYIISLFDTLEVKEVDLDKEFDNYCENLYLIDLENEPYAELFECAKHFFELGLKAKKE